MPRKDAIRSLVVAVGIGLFLLPTLINTGLYTSFYLICGLLFIVLPLLVLAGMTVAHKLAEKITVIWQVAKFGIVGVLNTAIDFGILNMLILMTNYTAGAGLGLINIPSFTAAIINSYFWNRKWVFEKSKEGNFVVFVIITIIGLSINTGVVYGVTTYMTPLFGLNPVLWANMAKVFATFFSMVWNFTGYKLIVFKK